MLCKLGLGLLLSTTFLWAQPMEGPWVVMDVATTDGPIAVALRDTSTADLFFGDAGASYRARFSFTNHDLAEPVQEMSPVYPYTHLHATASDGWWYALYYMDDGPNNSTEIFCGHDTLTTGYLWGEIDNGDTVGGPGGETSVSYSLALVPRPGGGCIVSWLDYWVYYGQNPPEFGVDFIAKRVTPGWPDWPNVTGVWVQPFATFESVQAFMPPSDSVRFAATMYSGDLCVDRVGPGDPLNCGVEHRYDCPVFVTDYLRTPSGREFVLGNASPGYEARLVELDSALHTCADVFEVAHDPIASASDVNWGMAWLSKPGAGLLLTTVDTTGFCISREGTVYWPPENWTVVAADLAISPTGWVVVCWRENALDQPFVSRIQIARVPWDAILSAHPQPEVVASPREFALSAYPNPFNNSVRISYDLPKAGEVELDIYDVLGRHVQTLLNQTVNAGAHSIVWTPDGTSGIYFIHLRAGDETRVQKLMFIK